MDKSAPITIHIPSVEDFDPEFSLPVTVPSTIVESTIDVLQGMMAQYKAEEGCEADRHVWDRLIFAAGLALAGLLRARPRQEALQLPLPLTDGGHSRVDIIKSAGPCA